MALKLQLSPDSGPGPEFRLVLNYQVGSMVYRLCFFCLFFLNVEFRPLFSRNLENFAILHPYVSYSGAEIDNVDPLFPNLER